VNFILELSLSMLYAIPTVSMYIWYPPITSKFGNVEEVWLSSSSTFKFSDNLFDYFSEPTGKFTYGEIIFAEFDQGAKKLQGCTADCTSKYRLQARYYTYESYSVFSIESAVIVTSMNRFYQRVDISYNWNRYQGTVFVGVSFRDHKGITVTSNKYLYNYSNEL